MRSLFDGSRWLLVVAATMAALVLSTISATTVNGVGYETTIPPIRRAPPYHTTPFDTTLVSVRAPREARLACQESVPLYRTAICDITTRDNCGNIYGRPGNISDWVVTVTNAVSGSVSALVSPVMFLQDGVARFYFTAIELSVYEVSVTRSASSHMPALLTPLPMKALVVVHNTISKCTQRTVLNTQAQLARTLWASASFSNEYRGGVPGLEGLPKPTSVVTDTEWIYPDPNRATQTTIRRAPLAPRVLTTIEDPLPADDAHYKYCDVIQQG